MQFHVWTATVACLYLQLLLLVICELTIYFASSQNICMHNFLWFAMSPLLAFLHFYQTRSKGVTAVRFSFFFFFFFCIAVFTLCLLASYCGLDNGYRSLGLEDATSHLYLVLCQTV